MSKGRHDKKDRHGKRDRHGRQGQAWQARTGTAAKGRHRKYDRHGKRDRHNKQDRTRRAEKSTHLCKWQRKCRTLRVREGDSQQQEEKKRTSARYVVLLSTNCWSASKIFLRKRSTSSCCLALKPLAPTGELTPPLGGSPLSSIPQDSRMPSCSQHEPDAFTSREDIELGYHNKRR